MQLRQQGVVRGETGIQASQVTELDSWDEVTQTAQPGLDQELEFVCTPA